MLVAHVQPGEEDDQDAANNVNRKIGPASEVGKIVGKRKSHRGDATGSVAHQHDQMKNIAMNGQPASRK